MDYKPWSSGHSVSTQKILGRLQILTAKYLIACSDCDISDRKQCGEAGVRGKCFNCDVLVLPQPFLTDSLCLR